MISVVKKSITSLTLVGLIASSASMHAISMPDTSKIFNKRTGVALASFLLFAGWYRLLTKKGNKNPQADVQELLAGDNMGENLVNVVDDYIIGQPKKDGSVVADKTTGVLKLDGSEKQEARGILGSILSVLKPFSEATLYAGGTLVGATLIYDAIFGEGELLHLPFALVKKLKPEGCK